MGLSLRSSERWAETPRGIGCTRSILVGAARLVGPLPARLDHFFHNHHHVVVNEDVARGKPAPDVFLLAASRLGVPPSQCLVLEDSITGAEAGLSAGMSVILVPDHAAPPAEYLERVLLVAGSLDEAAPHVLRAVRAA